MDKIEPQHIHFYLFIYIFLKTQYGLGDEQANRMKSVQVQLSMLVLFYMIKIK